MAKPVVFAVWFQHSINLDSVHSTLGEAEEAVRIVFPDVEFHRDSQPEEGEVRAFWRDVVSADCEDRLAGYIRPRF
jgi:hypothetical protein